jgi:thiopurine S-methyltransferase
MEKYSSSYWNEHYLKNKTGWDIGYISTPIKEYIDQLKDKDIKILIPGAGNAYEVEYLFLQGFSNVFLLDFSEQSILNFLERCPDFPTDHIFFQDFFEHHGTYDLVLEQTFFSAIPPQKRHLYVEVMSRLLVPTGKLVGLFFGIEFPFEGPPFGGKHEDYVRLFSADFDIQTLELANNSIKPRKGSELFFVMRKKRN